MPTISFLARSVAVVLAAGLLCLPAAWNGLPFFYPDTPTYLRGAETVMQRLAGRASASAGSQTHASAQAPAAPIQPQALPSQGLTSLDDKVVLAGRSVYYGALLHGARQAGSWWVAVAVQALSVAYVLHLLVVRLWRVPVAAFVAMAAGLALVTPLGVYASLLMPDVFAGLGLLIVATLCVYWRQLGTLDRLALAGLLLFGLCAHASHAAVALLLLLLVAMLRWRGASWQGLSLPAMGVVAACIVGAVAAEWAFAQGVNRALGAPPLRLPHTTARLIDMGPGTDFLRQHCPSAGYAVCAYTRNYPTPWDEFLFSADPARGTLALADAATKRRISAEQGRFVMDVIAHDPAGVLRGWATDLVRQLLSFRVDVWSLGPRELAMYAGRVAPETLVAMQEARGWNAPAYNRALTIATYASTIAAALAAVWWAWRRRVGAQARVPQRLEQVAWIAIGGVMANALVCATAASSLDRFQARVVWVLPFLAMAVLALVGSHAARRLEGSGARAPGTGRLAEVTP